MPLRTILFAGMLCFAGAESAFAGVIPLQPQYDGENLPKNQVWGKNTFGACVPYAVSKKTTTCAVRYLTANDRLAYKLTWNGKVWVDATNKPYDSAAAFKATKLSLSKVVADTQAREELGGIPAIWVMDPQNNLYVSVTQKPGEFHHSSFMGGGLIQAGGQVVIKDGIITAISNASGHYKPTKAQFMAALKNLKYYNPQGVWCLQSTAVEPGCAHQSIPWQVVNGKLVKNNAPPIPNKPVNNLKIQPSSPKIIDEQNKYLVGNNGYNDYDESIEKTEEEDEYTLLGNFVN